MFDKVLSFDDVLLKPMYSSVEHRADVSLKTSISGVTLDIPIVSANMSSVTGPIMAATIANLGGLGLLHRMYRDELEMGDAVTNALLKATARRGSIGFSFGISEGWEKWVQMGIDRGARIGCLDVAHANNKRVLEAVKELRHYNFPFIIGNIADWYAYDNLARAICDGMKHPNEIRNTWKRFSFKVGIGGGSLCTTRIMTGCGLPTFHSVYKTRDRCSHESGIIADGGIRSSGDIVKSLAAGANAVMLGSLLAGTTEAPGDVIASGKEKALYKVYRGSASFGDKKLRGENQINIEGTEALVPYKGTVEDIVYSLCDGIRSGMSYVGAKNLSELKDNAVFVEITNSGLNESHPHGLR